jgi:amidohydrolase
VIPGSVEILGTVRSFDAKIRQSVPKMMERVVKGITEANGGDYEFSYEFGYRPVINDHKVTEIIENTILEVYGEETLDRMKPNMGGEDFSAYQQKAQGTFFYIGAGNKEKGAVYPHHHARFEIDEDALEKGVRIFVHGAFKLLDQ